MMHVNEFNQIINSQLESCKETLVSKAAEYATADRLHNFKIAAALEGCTPSQSLGGMMVKHTVSIYDMLQDQHSYSDEMWDEKITDHLCYLFLLKATLVEDRRKEECAKDVEIPKQDPDAFPTEYDDIYKKGTE